MDSNFVLNKQEIRQFIRDGYLEIPNAFPQKLAEDIREILWCDIKNQQRHVNSWEEPVVKLDFHDERPFFKAANTSKLIRVIDQLAGRGRWKSPAGIGNFNIRFPSDKDIIDTQWHVDGSIPGKDKYDLSNYRNNIFSHNRILSMIFLFSDVEEYDAPTLLSAGSHLEIAKILAPYGNRGLTFTELDQQIKSIENVNIIPATGTAGTVYLCHPFLAYREQSHQGIMPRFVARPSLLPSQSDIIKTFTGYSTPVEEAINLGLKSITV